MASSVWQFAIDVGGTFTDVVARDPRGTIKTFKLLSTGIVRGVVGAGSSEKRIVDPHRKGEPNDVWRGYTMQLFDGSGSPVETIPILASEGVVGSLTPGGSFGSLSPGGSYSILTDETAPVMAIRFLMGLSRDDEIGEVDVRLGTTRATNALLERKGARTALVTTKGFADVLRIGYQDRPRLFDLNIRKRDELYEHVVEIDERIDARGHVLRAPDPDAVAAQLQTLRDEGIESLAICLLHAHINPAHERITANAADRVGFACISCSSEVSAMERIVPRGDTTVLDAYLTPVIQGYIELLRLAMPQARLRIMTNAGGLMESQQVRGKDTVLSGPAGGVVGCRDVALQAGSDRAIGFDMGGTSTDVCRIEPGPQGLEYENETVKAGVRLMTPMLAVETVAAGGGSICAFDGVKLVVGPHSAGAEPGPACYGRGGPLTVTDCNVLLGRVPPELFPFPLLVENAAKEAEQIIEEVAQATERRYTVEQLARGFIDIANAQMAAAIKRISLAKGYDVREYALVSFGGAAGQHACAVARLLGITRIVHSPYAGVLSAAGIAVTREHRVEQISVDWRLDSSAGERIQQAVGEITGRLGAALRVGQTGAANVGEPAVTLGMCYAGQSSLMDVALEPFKTLADRFGALHEQCYGYRHSDRPVEIRTLRVELALTTEPFALVEPKLDSPGGEASERDAASRFPVLQRRELQRGKPLEGPTIVVEPTSTLVLDEGWEGEVRDEGVIVVTDRAKVGTGVDVGTERDPIQLELFNNRFAAIAEQMGTTLQRTALSTNVKERLDFSCAVFTSAGDLVVNAPHIPVHLGGLSDCVKCLMEDVGTFQSGDVYVTNDPYRGGSHLNDVTVITPVFDSECDRLLFFVASRAHHAEIGGSTPGSMPPDSRSLAEEGVLIRAFHWLDGGKPRHEQLRELLVEAEYPSRAPDENLADIAAQVAANQTGVRELGRLVVTFGIDVVRAYMQHIQNAAATKMRGALAKLPPGRREFEDALDDGSTIRVAITVEDGSAVVDFGGTDPVLPGNLNANRAIVTSAILYCFRCLIDEDIPLNAGVLEPIEIVLPGCFLNPPARSDPRASAAMAGGNVETSQRIVDCILGALGVAAASQGTMNNLLIGSKRFGYYETICGGAGAGDGFDGASAVHTHMTNTRLTDPEVLESRYPMRLVRFEIRSGSGGAGRWRGGDGVMREIEFLESLDVSLITQRRTRGPYGLCGGEAGSTGANVLIRRGGQSKQLPSIGQVRVDDGDRIVMETPGGGGYGSP